MVAEVQPHLPQIRFVLGSLLGLIAILLVCFCLRKVLRRLYAFYQQWVTVPVDVNKRSVVGVNEFKLMVDDPVSRERLMTIATDKKFFDTIARITLMPTYVLPSYVKNMACPFCMALAWALNGTPLKRKKAASFLATAFKNDQVPHECAVNGCTEANMRLVAYYTTILAIYRIEEEPSVEGTGTQKKKFRLGSRNFVSGTNDIFLELDDTVEDTRAFLQHWGEELDLELAEARAMAADGVDDTIISMLENNLDYWRRSMQAFDNEQRAQNPHWGSNGAVRRPVREAAQPEVLFADDEAFVKVVTQVCQEQTKSFLEKNRIDRDHHDKVVAKSVTKAKVQKRALESQMPSSSPMMPAKNTCYAVFQGAPGQHGLLTSNGTHIVIVTHRHCIVDGMAQDRVHSRGTPVAIRYPNMPKPLEATVVGVAALDRDEVWYVTDAPADINVQPVRKPKTAPNVGEPCQAYWYDPNADAWVSVVGTIAHVDKKAGMYYYTFTTSAGCCRMPVYNGNGDVICGHLYGSMVYSGNRLANAGEVFLDQQQLVRQYSIRLTANLDMRWDWSPKPLVDVQGVSTPGDMPRVELPELFYMKEPRKVWGLRTDVDISGFRPAYYLMKPSTEMNHKEVQKYGEHIVYDTHKEVFEQAIISACMMDSSIGTPWVPPNFDDLQRVLVELDSDHKSAGFTGRNKTHSEYIAFLGGGDPEEGLRVLGMRVADLYSYMLDPSSHPDKQKLFAECSIWNVMGKKDGYKEKKLEVGRTIQAPCLEMKVLWRLCFGANDKDWISRPDMEGLHVKWVHAGTNFDKPVRGVRRERMEKALGALALDETAFDRHMTPEYIDTFFTQHMPYTNPGVPNNLLQSFARFVKSGPLLMSDGVIYLKNRGNPSGFMNTLRLNCWANMLAWHYIIARRLQQLGRSWEDVHIFDVATNDLYIEICGDDVRVWALTRLGLDILDFDHEHTAVLQIWEKELPWATKLEGTALFDMTLPFEDRVLVAPPMVSRRLVVVHGILWEPLINVSRAVRRLIHDEPRDLDLESELITSAFATNALMVYWHMSGLVYSPPIANLLRVFGMPAAMDLVRAMVAALYRRAYA